MSLDNKKEVKGQTLEKLFSIIFVLMFFVSTTVVFISVKTINNSIREVKEAYDAIREKEIEEEEKIKQEKQFGNYYFEYYIENYLLGTEYEQEYLGDDFDIKKADVIDRKDMGQKRKSIIFDYIVNGEKHFLFLLNPEKDYLTVSQLGKLKDAYEATMIMSDTFLINHFLKVLLEDDALQYMELPSDTSLIDKECYYIIRDDSKIIDFEINTIFVYRNYKIKYYTKVSNTERFGFESDTKKTVNEND